MESSVTASIVVYKTDKNELGRCVASLQNSPVSIIYICDNSPSDDLKAFCSGLDKVCYIFNNANIGYGAAHNIAIRESLQGNAAYHLVINPDVYFSGGVIEALTQYMDKNTDVAQVIPNVIYPDGKLQYVCRLLPTPANLIFRRFLPEKMTEKMNYRYLLKFSDHKKAMNVPYLMGCFMFFRVSAFNTVGLFDERFFMYPEDIDITRRMHRCYRTMFWPEVTIIHAHRAESYKNKKMLTVHIRNMIRYFNKWGWFRDKERKDINRKLLSELNYKI